MDDIIQLKITLQRTKPPIWRRVLVNSKTKFSELHMIIQTAMGWTNSHLHDFLLKDLRIGNPADQMEDPDYDNVNYVDASTVTLETLIKEAKERFEYEYDFGDGWKHEILVEKFLPRDSETIYPICIDGELNCPPEDSGGVGGFYYMLEISQDKKHPDYLEMSDWLGRYNPKHFDKNKINRKLKTIKGNKRKI